MESLDEVVVELEVSMLLPAGQVHAGDDVTRALQNAFARSHLGALRSAKVVRTVQVKGRKPERSG